MKLTLESTPLLVRVPSPDQQPSVPARRWEGIDDSGTPVVALICHVSPQSHDPAVVGRFAAELVETPSPLLPVSHRRRIERLGAALLETILQELKSDVTAPENLLVALNALACAAANLIDGDRRRQPPEHAAEARRFFRQALHDNLIELADGRGPLR